MKKNKIYIFITALIITMIVFWFIPVKEKVIGHEIENVGNLTIMPRIYVKKQKYNIYNFSIGIYEETIGFGNDEYSKYY